MKKVFQSKRIHYRLPQPSDAQDIYDNISWSVIKNIGPAPWPYALEDAKHFILICDEHSKKQLCYDYILREKEHGTFIGLMSLHIAIYEDCNMPGMIGYWIAEQHRRKGYAFEAIKEIINLAKEIKLNKVWIRSRQDNTPSIELAKKIGMRYIKQETGVFENKEMPQVRYEMDLR